jgi:hypothetical protein
MAGSPPRIVILAIRAPLLRADLPGLVERTCVLLDGHDAEELRCEAPGIAADAVAIDALARLALAARRHGCRVRLCGAYEQLCALVRFAGLAEVLRC